MPRLFYATVWIDHRTAEVTHIDATNSTRLLIHSHASVQALHHQKNPGGGDGQASDQEFFARVSSVLASAGAILIAGPGQVKFALARYLGEHRASVAAHVHQIETADQPSDEALLELAREHFQLTT